MPKLNFTDIGDLQDYRYSVATITSVDSAADTAVLSTGDTALIFYHCESDSALRDNGAIVGGAAGFAVGSGVVVLKKYDGSKVYVIGHTDGIRSCQEPFERVYSWINRIYPDDGSPLDYYHAYFPSTISRVLTITTKRPLYSVDYVLHVDGMGPVFDRGPYPFNIDWLEPISYYYDVVCSAGPMVLLHPEDYYLEGTGSGNGVFTITVTYHGPQSQGYHWSEWGGGPGGGGGSGPYLYSCINGEFDILAG